MPPAFRGSRDSRIQYPMTSATNTHGKTIRNLRAKLASDAFEVASVTSRSIMTPILETPLRWPTHVSCVAGRGVLRMPNNALRVGNPQDGAVVLGSPPRLNGFVAKCRVLNPSILPIVDPYIDHGCKDPATRPGSTDRQEHATQRGHNRMKEYRPKLSLNSLAAPTATTRSNPIRCEAHFPSIRPAAEAAVATGWLVSSHRVWWRRYPALVGPRRPHRYQRDRDDGGLCSEQTAASFTTKCRAPMKRGSTSLGTDEFAKRMRPSASRRSRTQVEGGWV